MGLKLWDSVVGLSSQVISHFALISNNSSPSPSTNTCTIKLNPLLVFFVLVNNFIILLLRNMDIM